MQEMGRMATALPITAPRVERHHGALTGGRTALAPARAAHGEVASTLHPAAEELIPTKMNQFLHILQAAEPLEAVQ